MVGRDYVIEEAALKRIHTFGKPGAQPRLRTKKPSRQKNFLCPVHEVSRRSRDFWRYPETRLELGGGEAIIKYKIARKQAGVELMEVLPLLLLGDDGGCLLACSATGR